MATHERLGSDSQPDAGERREELRFSGEYRGFDPQLRARKLGELALIAIRMWAKDDDTAGDARLVLAELLVNTFEHGHGPSVMTVANVTAATGESFIEISTSNAVDTDPAEYGGAHEPDIDNEISEDGRGITIIGSLTNGNWEQTSEPLPDDSGYVVRVTARVPNGPSRPAPNGNGNDTDASQQAA